MGKKKSKEFKWVQYRRQSEIIEITVRDASYRKLDNFKCGDKKQYRKALKVIAEKYGYEPEVQLKEFS